MGRVRYEFQLVNLVNQMPGMLVHHQQVELQVGNRFWCFGPLLGPLTLWLNYSSHHPFSKPRNARQMEYGVESWWMYFVWCLGNSYQGIRMHYLQDTKNGIRIFTQLIYTRGKILNKNCLDSLLTLHPQHHCRIPIALLLLQKRESKETCHHSFIWREQPQA